LNFWASGGSVADSSHTLVTTSAAVSTCDNEGTLSIKVKFLSRSGACWLNTPGMRYVCFHVKGSIRTQLFVEH
jgi:hypothetical protein